MPYNIWWISFQEPPIKSHAWHPWSFLSPSRACSLRLWYSMAYFNFCVALICSELLSAVTLLGLWNTMQSQSFLLPHHYCTSVLHLISFGVEILPYEPSFQYQPSFLSSYFNPLKLFCPGSASVSELCLAAKFCHYFWNSLPLPYLHCKNVHSNSNSEVLSPGQVWMKPNLFTLKPKCR